MSKLSRHLFRRFPVLFFAGVVAFLAPLLSIAVFAQNNDAPPSIKVTSRDDKDDQSSSIGEMVVKQQITRRKKEHDELLKRGEEVLKLSEELETSIAENETLTAQDLTKLQTLEKAVSKIRSDLGGDDDDEKFLDDSNGKETTARQNIASAFRYLRESTKKLVDELKRTSRFSVSAAAIQTSNAVIRFARFLRLKK
jgi:hypothetical protein